MLQFQIEIHPSKSKDPPCSETICALNAADFKEVTNSLLSIKEAYSDYLLSCGHLCHKNWNEVEMESHPVSTFCLGQARASSEE